MDTKKNHEQKLYCSVQQKNYFNEIFFTYTIATAPERLSNG